MGKEYITLSRRNRLVFSFKKDNFQRIGNAFMHCISFFYLFARESKGILGMRRINLHGQFRALTVWSAGSFGKGLIRSLMLRKELRMGPEGRLKDRKTVTWNE